MIVPVKKETTSRTITVNYNPEELELIDLFANTPKIDTTAGVIAGTNISVTVFTPGKIVYVIDQVDKTVMQSIKFASKTSGQAKVTYVIT